MRAVGCSHMDVLGENTARKSVRIVVQHIYSESGCDMRDVLCIPASLHHIYEEAGTMSECLL